MSLESTTPDVRRRAGWLPEQGGLEAWLRGLSSDEAAVDADRRLHPAVHDLRRLVEADPVLRMQVERMVAEVPSSRTYSERHVRDVDHLYRLLDAVLASAPTFSADSMVMTPVAAVLDWAMATPSGFAAFRNPAFNAGLRRLLDGWRAFLDSPASLSVLHDGDGGWRSPAAQQAVGMHQFVHDPEDEHWGFASWNDFFTRRFRDGQRPVAAPDDNTVIANACESTPYHLGQGVRRSDRFWLKGQPYSLRDMLAGHPSVERFVGGTVYQAFLSALDYHRWHAPVAGTVVHTQVVPGTYFSEADSMGVAATEPQESQGYQAHVATRAIVLLEADEPAIGQVAAVFVGMADVSSCVVADEVTPGAHVDKGAELGHFAYGGSTHCLVFEPDVVRSFSAAAIPRPDEPHAPLVHVRSQLATTR